MFQVVQQVHVKTTVILSKVVASISRGVLLSVSIKRTGTISDIRITRISFFLAVSSHIIRTPFKYFAIQVRFVVEKPRTVIRIENMAKPLTLLCGFYVADFLE